MRAAIIGANGQLGADILTVLSSQGIESLALNHNSIEITNIDSICKALDSSKPDCLINTAAMHNVELCEEKPTEAYLVNAIGSKNLALACSARNIVLLHVSTDYVFDGTKQNPYVESDLPLPVNVYGNTKLAGEYFIQSLAKRYFILRTCGLYGKNLCRAKGRPNFVETMIQLSKEKEELKVVADEVLTPTSTIELAQQIVKLIPTEYYGLYHATAEGSCSWNEFTAEILRLIGSQIKLSVPSSSDFKNKTPRPQYSVLENAKLKKHGLNIFKPWQDGLRNYIENIR